MAHIGIDARLTAYRIGGTSAYIRYLLAALEPLDQVNRYTVLHSRKSTERLVERLPHAPLWTPPHHRLERVALSVELARWRLDVLHSPDFIPPWRGARRHVITIHDLAFLIYPEHMTAESQRYYNAQIHYAARHADHILTPSESTRCDVIERLNVAPEKVTVQLHGVSPRFQPLPADELAQVRQRFNLPQTFLLFVGTFEPRKNLSGLLDAYERLRADLPDAPPLVVVGNVGWLIDDTVARLRSTPGVIVVEGVSHDVLPAIYNLAHTLILPAFYEGFGLPALEAMACGTVPVVSNLSSLPEVVGEVGIRVNPHDTASIADGLRRVLTADSEWLAQQSRAAIARASSFTWERSARIAMQTYQAVL